MEKKIYSLLIIAAIILGSVTSQIGAQLNPIDSDKNCTTDAKNEFDHYNNSVDKAFQSQFGGGEEDVVVTCYTFGMPGEPSKEIEISQHEAEYLLDKINELNFEVASDPLSEKTQQLQDEIVDLADECDLLPAGLSKSNVKEYLFHSYTPQTNRRGILPIQSKASEFLCTFVSTGSGSVLPIIALPRLIPILMIPIPRLFMRWKAQDAVTSCGGLRSGTGFIAYGQQKGVALGFWGLGFTFSLPPFMGVYGLIGYALFATVDADRIEYYPPNSPPIISQIDPYDGEIDVTLSLSELRFQIFDYDGDLMSYTVTTTPDIGSGNGNLKPDGVYSVPVSGLDDLTEYSWHIEVTDGMDTTTNDFIFTTEAVVPIVSNPSPRDDERYVPVSLSQISFHLKDFQGDPMDYTVETVPDIGSGSGTGVGDGIYSVPVSGLDYSLECTWYVNVTDGEHQTNKIFHFQIEHKMTFDPFTDGWQYRKEITIDHTKIDGDLVNFPLLISTIDVDLRDKAQDDGDDILFMNRTGIANRLYHEIEHYDSSSGNLVVWLGIESLSSINDTVIYMYYSNPICYNQHAPELVWDSDYMGVWHFTEASSKLYDSTFNNNDGAICGGSWTDGISGYALDFDGQDDYVDVGDKPSLDITGDITIALWFRTDTIQFGTLVNKLDSADPDNGYCLIMDNGFGWGPAGTISFKLAKDSYGWLHEYDMFTTSSTFTNNEWYHLNAIYTPDGSSRPKIYINAVEQTAGTYDGSALSSIGASPGYDFRIAERSICDSNFDGAIDEVRISDTEQSSAWILASYDNQNDPSSFVSFGPEEPAP